jgi:hypothetical protein
VGGTYVTKQTTLTSAGAGEQIPLNRPKGRLVLAVVGVAALAAVGLFVARSRGGKGDGTAGGGHAPVAVATLGATKDPGPSTASKPATPEAPAEVTLVVESEPSGARVVGADDQVLGATPLTLTRPAKGPGLSLRVEKDGYVTVSRTVSLVRDETLSITLERKPRPASKPKRPAVDEPARL